jgi:GT2 family glycosyltransferase
MRSRAAAAFGVIAVVAIAALLLGAARDERPLAFTLGVAPSTEVISLKTGVEACQTPIEVLVGFRSLEIATEDFSGRARVRVLDGRDQRVRLTDVVVRRAAWDGRWLHVPTAPIGHGRLVSVCIENLGKRRMHLLGGSRISHLPSDAYVKGNDLEVDFAVVFERAKARSLLTLAPDVFERASLLRWPWLEPWMLWVLGLGVLLGVPALIGAALLRAETAGGGAALGWAGPSPAKGGVVGDGPPAAPVAGKPPSYAAFIRTVEPALLEHPRVHRAGRPAIVGEFGAVAETVALVELPEDSSALPTVIGNAREPLIAIARPGSQVSPRDLERLGRAAALAPDAAVITCDDDELSRGGRRTNPRLHPGPAPDYLLSSGSEPPLLVVRPARAAQAAGQLGGGAPLLELLLRLGGPDGSGHAHVPQILCHREQGQAMPPPDAHAAAARTALQAWGEAAARIEATSSGGRRVRRAIASEPEVELIVPFRDRHELLARCADSVLERTAYERLRLHLVDNGSVETETKALLDRLASDPRVTVERDERAFNFSAVCNGAASRSSASVLIFLNNDTELLAGERRDTWIEDLLEETLRPAVGAVAPLLLYDDGSVQHAGAAIGLHGYAGHPFAGLSPEKRTAFGAAADGTRNWTAVSAACVMVERAKFEAVGGFDEAFTVAGGDVDLCLRLLRGGYRSLCVAHTRLIHHESRSRGAHIDPGDFPSSEASYGEFRTVGDPLYNPNLTLRATDCSLRRPGE